MALMVECPNCKKKHGASAKVCMSRSGKGCGAKLSQGTKIYWVSYRDPEGKTKQRRIGPSKKAAENFQNKVKVEIAEEKYIDKKEELQKVLIKDFIDESYDPWCKVNNRGYRTKRGYLNAISRLWGDKYLDELTNEEIERYKWQMLKEKKTVMFNRVLSTLSHMYTIAVEFGKIEACPFTTLKKKVKEKGRLRYLMPDEVKRLVDTCAEHLRPIVITALHTGMRKTEVLTLRLGPTYTDLEKRLITLGKTKNDEPRFIPINDTLFSVLKDAADGKQLGEYMFSSAEGGPYADVKTSFRTALKRAEIEDFHFHDLRHTFASNLVMNGVDLFAVKELLGHKDIKMTMKYAHLSPEHKSQAVRMLDNVYGGKSAIKVIDLGTRIGTHEESKTGYTKVHSSIGIQA